MLVVHTGINEFMIYCLNRKLNVIEQITNQKTNGLQHKLHKKKTQKKKQTKR